MAANILSTENQRGGGGVETVGSDQFASTQTFFFFLFS